MDSIAAASGQTSRPYLTAFSIFIVSCSLAIILQVFFFSPITPDPLELPPAYSASLLPTNSQLQRVIKLGEGLLDRPEDVCVDKNGVLYTATRDGWIKRFHRNGSWEDWRRIQSDALLGLKITKEGSVIVCDAEKGLLKFGEDGVTVLASQRFANDVVEASDGSLYFSVASTKFGIHDWFFDVLEAKPHGQLLKFRCLKYWLSGEGKGKTEIFVDNLPGGPDNIKLAPDGSFWIALLQLTSGGLEYVHTSRALKHLVATFPKLLERVKGMHMKATIVNVAPDGRIIRSFDDPDGAVMSFVTSALEFENHLYLGSLNSNFVGKLSLNGAK
ncbi:hypothetical protein Vadar_017666 [Vaccinium darrowii]|uniref:Uncharacterized protein n=1 Tax=Vaccinium darrowii TaxID=229202 RepID=A0ACB7YWD2_9ERIC|nr:hypothetical protein Vadar_017666 [Vaccinium darrowii]